MLRVRPKHGLCNRLRAIASAYELAKERGDRLEVHWDISYDMNARFSDLFETVGDFVVVEDGSGAKFFSSDNQDYRDERVMRRGGVGFEEFIQTFFSAPLTRDFAFDSSSDFYGGNFEWLRPRVEIAKKITEELRLLPGRYVGVHIRRTDNVQARLYSPLKLFVKAIREEMESDAGIGVFVASDDEQVKKMLKVKFGARCHFRDMVARRDEPLGVRDAVIDLMILSRGERVYGCYWSSFSETAAAIGSSDCGKDRYVQLCVSGCEKHIADFRLALMRFQLKIYALGSRFLRRMIGHDGTSIKK